MSSVFLNVLVIYFIVTLSRGRGWGVSTYHMILGLDTQDVGVVDLSALLLKPEQDKQVLQQIQWEIAYTSRY